MFLENSKDLMRLELGLIKKRLIGVGQEPNDNVSLIIMKITHESEEETAGINIVSLAFWFFWSQTEQEIFAKKWEIEILFFEFFMQNSLIHYGKYL